MAASAGDIAALCGDEGAAAVELEELDPCASSFFSCAEKVPAAKQNTIIAKNTFLEDIAHPVAAQVTYPFQARKI
jgi:hypothetical protein